jgi:hypothetical protein
MFRFMMRVALCFKEGGWMRDIPKMCHQTWLSCHPKALIMVTRQTWGGFYPTFQSSFACQSHTKPQNMININININIIYFWGQACERQVLYSSINDFLMQFPTCSPQRKGKRIITFI